jgi:putative ABC transport system permease protein
MTTRLPIPARLMLRLTDPRVREFVAGDIEESLASFGPGDAARARRWAHRQALAAMVQHPWRPVRSPRTGDGIMRTLLQDLKYGARMVRRQPTFSAVVVMTLALAIGANTVIFSFANVLLLRPLPLKDTGTLGWIFAVDPHRGGNRGLLSVPEFLDYRASLTTFESLGASTRASVVLTGRGDARRLQATRVTANLIDLWGLRMQMGRPFSAGADAPGAAGEAVVSYHYWDRDLNRDPSIVGQTLMLDGHPATVTGVLAPEIEIGNLSEIDVWIPLALSPDLAREERTLRVNGRLKPGTTLVQANADVLRVAQLLARDHPRSNEGWSARVAPTREAMTGNDTMPIMVLLSLVVGLVLLLACANLANLVLSRATGRRRELALRSALGASRVRVVRQMLTENLIYGLCGGALGLAIAKGGLDLMRAVAYEPFFRMLTIDRNVLVFTAALALVTPVLFAMLPALQSTRADAGEALKDGGARSAGGARVTRSRSVLIVAQLSLAVMLLVLATLLVQALVKIADAPLGVDARKMLTARLELPAWRYGTPAAVGEFQRQLIDRLRSNAAVEQAATVDRLPILDGEPMTDVVIEGRATGRPEDRPWAVSSTVSDGYFAATGMPMIAGRGFTEADTPERPPVAVVNKEMARRYWGSPEKALGARLTTAGDPSGLPLQVVGISSDVLRSDREAVNPQVYLSSRQRPARSVTLVVRAGDPAGVAAAVREQIRGLDTDVPVYEVRPFQQAIDEDLSSSRILGSLFASFALLALALAASGLYAVVSYAAAQRIKEFGVRIALGATGSDIVAMMLRQTGRLVLIGLAIGLVGGRLLALGATSLLYRVSAWDPATYVGVAAGLGAIALLASYVPVRRAMSIDPVRALRLE